MGGWEQEEMWLRKFRGVLGCTVNKKRRTSERFNVLDAPDFKRLFSPFLKRHFSDNLVPMGCGVNEFPQLDLEKELQFWHDLLSKKKNSKQEKNHLETSAFKLLFSALGTGNYTDYVFKNSLSIFRIGHEFEN